MGDLPQHPVTPSQTRLTLPLRDSPILGPFRLDHDAQFTSKVFHVEPQLFETLRKSVGLNTQTAAVIQELQFCANLVKQPTGNSQGDSLLASNNQLNAQVKVCNWPEHFQVSINQNIVHLDRPKTGHRAVDVYGLCRPGDNVLDIQVNDCYCVSLALKSAPLLLNNET